MMKERSLVERIVAILGVLVGTVAWVVRLLFSLLKGLLSGGAKSDEGEAGAGRAPVADTAKTYATDIKHKSESLIDEVKEKGEHLIGDVKARGENLVEDVRDKGQDLVGEARHKVDDVLHRGAEDEGGEGDVASFSAEGSASADRSDVSATQHEDIGGVPAEPESGAVAAASLSAMDTVYDEQSAGSMSDEDTSETSTHLTEGIPNLLEPGEADESDMYGSETGSLMGHDADTGYAGQAMSESDIGIDRGDSVSGLADSGDENQFRGWISDVVQTDQDDTEEEDEDWVADGDVEIEPGTPLEYDAAWVTDQINADDDEDEDDDDDEVVPAASRGWEQPEDDVLKGDPLYGDVDSFGAGGEVDLLNDEAGDEGGAGMHIVDSPDEPFIEDEDASQAMGFASMGTDAPFDTTAADGIDVDEIGDETVSLGEDQLAADAYGHPAGGDAASGDLGPDESPDDATWEPGASRPDYDVPGSYDGSGVDEFASDAVAESMLDDVMSATGDDAASAGESGEGEDSGASSGNTGSIAWATSAGVVDRDLAKPMSADDLQSGSDADTSEADASGEPGATEADAGLRDVAADVAQDLDQEMGEGTTATGTTMSGAGQSAGAMTSDDAANGDEGADGTTSDSGSFETGGVPATDVQDGDEAMSGDASSGTSGSGGFHDVLPESEYATDVGYETLQADDSSRGGRDDFSESSFLTETSTSGVTPATTSTASDSTTGTKRPAPSGSVRGDGSGTCPAGFPIKGNASSKIYHRPTDSSYQSTIPEFCFATEEDARAAGFRARRG